MEHTREEIAIPNIVTAILASYRGFDTMGEVGVIFTAGISITALLMNLPQMRQTTPTPMQQPASPEPATPSQPTPQTTNRKKTASAKKHKKGKTKR
jgi:hypothetical protein